MDSKITRRDVAVGIGVGYALSVLPVTAWAVTTPADGLETGGVQIPTGKDGKEMMPAFLAAPKTAGTFPVVIVVHEIFGVHEYIRDVCRRLAKEGYLAVAPDLFFRNGDATKIEDRKKLMDEIVAKQTQAAVLADLDAVSAWAKKDKRADAKKMAITGYCWGGNVVWMYAAHNPELKAGIAWYGRVKGDVTPAQPKFPMDVAASLTVPVLGLYGEKDGGIPLADVDAMRKELGKSKSGSQMNVYIGAEHGFHADYRPSYNEKAAKEAWTELLAWLGKHGVKA